MAFHLPDEGIATVNQLVVPAGTPLHFKITSAGVLNSFFVPQLGSQIYSMAGMTSQLNLQADKPGTFHGLSAHSAATVLRHALRRSAVEGDAYGEMGRRDARRGSSTGGLRSVGEAEQPVAP